MAVNTFERVPKVYHSDDIDLVKMTRIWDGMMEGRLNVTGEFIVAPFTTSTTVTDARMRANALVFWVPMTANSAAGNMDMYLTGRNNGSFVLNHASKNHTDLNYGYIIVG
jgi:hypothetical protein